MAECPDREELEAFVHRELDGDHRREVEQHRRVCKDCQKMITYLLRTNDLPFTTPMR